MARLILLCHSLCYVLCHTLCYCVMYCVMLCVTYCVMYCVILCVTVLCTVSCFVLHTVLCTVSYFVLLCYVLCHVAYYVYSVLYIVLYSALLYSRNLLQEEIFVNLVVLLSEIIFANFDYCIHNKRYMEDIWIQNVCYVALIFGNAFEITKFTKLKKTINSYYMVHTGHALCYYIQCNPWCSHGHTHWRC